MDNFPGAPKQPKDEQELKEALQKLYILKLEKIIRAMWPIWTMAVDWSEHNNSKALNAMREEYYNPSVKLRDEELELLSQVVSKKKP